MVGSSPYPIGAGPFGSGRRADMIGGFLGMAVAGSLCRFASRRNSRYPVTHAHGPQAARGGVGFDRFVVTGALVTIGTK
jgi:hypothetical protein